VREIFSLEFMRLAAVTGVASALALSVLGVYVVLKRVVFVGLTLANVATLGAALALALRLPLELTAIVASLGAAVPPRPMPWGAGRVGDRVGLRHASALTVLVRRHRRRRRRDAPAVGNVPAISRFEAVLAAAVAAVVCRPRGVRQALCSSLTPRPHAPPARHRH
jgi:hypothetical protein